MIQSWFTYFIYLTVNELQNRFIVRPFIDGLDKYFETVPNHVRNAVIGFFSYLWYILVLDNSSNFTQNWNEILSENFHVLLAGVFLQGSQNPQIVWLLEVLLANIALNWRSIHFKNSFWSEGNKNRVHHSFEWLFIEFISKTDDLNNQLLNLTECVGIQWFEELWQNSSCIFFIRESCGKHAFEHTNNFSKTVRLSSLIQVYSLDSKCIFNWGLVPQFRSNGVLHQKFQKTKCMLFDFASAE